MPRTDPWACASLLATLFLAACQPIVAVTPSAEVTTAEVSPGQAVTATIEPPETEADVDVAATAPFTSSAEVEVDAPGVETAPDPALVASGLEAYRQAYCGVCHVLTVAGTRGTFGPTHDGMGAAAATRIADPSYAGTATTPEEYILESLLDPQAYLVEGYEISSHRMPPFGHLDPATLEALVALLLAQ